MGRQKAFEKGNETVLWTVSCLVEMKAVRSVVLWVALSVFSRVASTGERWVV